MKIGDYVIVSSIPAGAEGLNETLKDRQDYVKHIGRIVEIDFEMVFVVFVSLRNGDYRVSGRWFDVKDLTVMSSPFQDLPQVLFDEQ